MIPNRETTAPTALSLDKRLQAMRQAGVLAWSGKKLRPMVPVARASAKRTVADLLIGDRVWSSTWKPNRS